MYNHAATVAFPSPKNIMVNMMPFVLGDPSTLPEELHGYLPLIDQCSELVPGEVAYLTVNESVVRAGASQRRPGIHTEGTSILCWGEGGWGGGWGGGRGNFGGGEFGGGAPNPPAPFPQPEPVPSQPEPKGRKLGLYMASTDGSCRIWDSVTHDVDAHGALLGPPLGSAHIMQPNGLYWLTDRTPHEALPVAVDTHRQFFRLVSHCVSAWWAQHSTSNPLGVQPGCRVLTHSKFIQ